MRPTARGARRVVGSAAPCPTSRFVISGGERGIRTHGTLTGTPDFESGTFGHSVSSPPRNLPGPRRIVKGPRLGAGKAPLAVRGSMLVDRLVLVRGAPPADQRGEDVGVERRGLARVAWGGDRRQGVDGPAVQR